MFENFLLSLLSGVLLAVPTYYALNHCLLRRLYLRRHLRCIVPYQPHRAERVPGVKS